MQRSLDRDGLARDVDDDFTSPELDRTLWLPHYLPQWSSRTASAARYRLADGALHLVVEPDQPPWCPEFDGAVRVSNLQTGVRSGPVGSTDGQHRFSDALVVREEQPEQWLHTPRYGLVEVRARMDLDATGMAALWLIGVEDVPEHSAEICVFEVFGRDVRPSSAVVGTGVHPFGNPRVRDDFARTELPVDVRAWHEYAVRWTPDEVVFAVDGQVAHVSDQSPDHRVQVMLDVYAFPAEGAAPTRQQLVVDRFRSWRPAPR
ncbi:glycoside hydrolase family 16 protein [Modestobacter sp. NPDC049651]|uniref:glycoside hydrolase family 16 protein n=1 Tax=unclassified Modestobacter TaxID=2643866 RepID=UPI0033C9900E